MLFEFKLDSSDGDSDEAVPSTSVQPPNIPDNFRKGYLCIENLGVENEEANSIEAHEIGEIRI